MQQNGVRRPSTAHDARDRFSDGRRGSIFAHDAVREAQVREEAGRGGGSLVAGRPQLARQGHLQLSRDSADRVAAC